MKKKCPVCLQLLPKGIDTDELQARLEEIAARARTQAEKALERDFNQRLPQLLEAERERAHRSAQRAVKQELGAAKRRADRAERDKAHEIQKIRRDAERTA